MGHLRASATFILTLSVSVAIACSGCTLFRGNGTAELWTNSPEFAAYVESFNAQNEDYRIELVYKPSPGASIRRENTPPDIVFSRSFTGTGIETDFMPLDRLMDNERIDPGLFYPELLNRGYRKGKQYLLPVSFTLPALMFPSDLELPDGNTFFLSYESIREPARTFNKLDESPLRMGFSPRWSTDSMYVNALLFGADFRTGENGTLAWNDNELQMSIAYIRDWSDSVNGGAETEDYFTSRYLYDPGFSLINRGVILFHYTDITSFDAIPANAQQKLDFRWIARDFKIPVLDDILYAGVPRYARNRKAAFAFLEWFFDPDTQKKLLAETRFKRIRTFGIAGGFSSLRTVNDRYFPQQYPILVGKIPSPISLSFPGIMPLEWTDIRQSALGPWLNRQTDGSSPPQSFRNAFSTWMLQRP